MPGKTLPAHALHVLSSGISFYLLMVLSAACSSPAKEKDKPGSYEELASYFKEKQGYTLTEHTKRIFILNDEGCMPCNKHFSELMTENLDDSTSLFLILASATNIDLSEFAKLKHRVFYDRPENIKTKVFDKSGLIFLRHKAIDTIISIDARQLELQFKTMKARLDGNYK